MGKMSVVWIDSQIEQEIERGNTPEAVRDLASLVTVRDYLTRGNKAVGEYTDMRQYGRRYAPEPESKAAEAMTGDRLSREDAERWVRHMHGADGTKGGRWSLQEVMQYAGNYGVYGDDVIEFFAAMNALYTNFVGVAKQYGVDKVDFWTDLAKAYMHDANAMPGKIKKYYEHIAMKGDE